jgi:hypothetical protein
MKSILAADCGSVTTTAVLVEQIEGEYRLRATGQAPSTYAAPWQDITIGVQEAIRHIERVVGRNILSPGGWPMSPQNAQQGVDAFTLVSSAGPPLQVIIGGLMQDISLASARRAAATTYTQVTRAISLDGTAHNSPAHGGEAWVEAMQNGQPEVILLVGGTDGGARLPVIEMAQLVSTVVQFLDNGAAPTILYGGNSDLRPEMADILGPVTPLKSVSNVRPRLDIEDPTAAQVELENLYVQKKMLRLPGFDKLRNWSKYPVEPTSKSFEKLIAYIGQYHHLNVLGLDIGSRSTTVSIQTAGRPADSTTRGDAGVGYGLAALLNLVPIEKFRRWLPFDISPAELYDRLLNKSLYPTTLPYTHEDVLIEQAVAREALRLVATQAQQHLPHIRWNLIVGAGRALTGAPLAAQAALTMIDGLELRGVTNLVLDKNGVVKMLGAVAAIEPLAAAQVATRDAFLNLGSVIAPAGHGAPGKPALKIKLDTGQGERLEKEVPYGAIEVIALSPGHHASLEMRPARNFDIGLGQAGRGAVAEVEGGMLGLIIDARGRPLRFPDDDDKRQEQLQAWLSSLAIPYAASKNSH